MVLMHAPGLSHSTMHIVNTTSLVQVGFTKNAPFAKMHVKGTLCHQSGGDSWADIISVNAAGSLFQVQHGYVINSICTNTSGMLECLSLLLMDIAKRYL